MFQLILFMSHIISGLLKLLLMFFVFILPAKASPVISGCTIFPADNIWNQTIDNLPLSSHSDHYIQSIGADDSLKADFGSGTWEGGPIGIPFDLVTSTTVKTHVSFDYDDESDTGPYPIPLSPQIEGGEQADGDRHILILNTDNCMLYELFYAWPNKDTGGWSAGSGAIYDLSSNQLRPDGWTSADAAGLPVLPGLLRYNEIASGEITHALRFTAVTTQRDYVWPARHFASSNTSTEVPPLGQRFRLKASFDITSFSATNQVILTALKKYGMILADNGSNWYLSGTPDEQWDNDDLRKLADISGSAFEAVDVSSLQVAENSAQVKNSSSQDTGEISTFTTSTMIVHIPRLIVNGKKHYRVNLRVDRDSRLTLMGAEPIESQ